MNAEALYEELKNALRFFGLRFSDMDQVHVSIVGNNLCFTYDKKQIFVPLEPK